MPSYVSHHKDTFLLKMANLIDLIFNLNRQTFNQQNPKCGHQPSLIGVLMYHSIIILFSLSYISQLLTLSINLLQLIKMSQFEWHSVEIANKAILKPSARWGHACCTIEDEFIVFGGFMNTNYMNDLWSYNLKTLKWREIKTSGDIPERRSNCSICYDEQNNQLIVFGGGGPNKQRFNTISLLNWETKQWIEIVANNCQMAPWERTYHVAQFKFPYLIVFGGECADDLSDLWVYNFMQMGWSQIKLENDATRPCARRFHSSCLINNKFYVIGGCYGKYKSLGDIYEMDLSELFQKANTSSLHWKKVELKEQFTPRWGHSSLVYNDCIYIFGGRSQEDQNDIVMINSQTGQVKNVIATGQQPNPRRRHAGAFIGSCMVIFGGFDGNYYEDLFYLNLYSMKSNMDQLTLHSQSYESFLNNRLKGNCCIYTKQDSQFYINTTLLVKHFANNAKLKQFLDGISRRYSIDELNSIFAALYQGYGENKLILEDKIKYEINFEENKPHPKTRIQNIIQEELDSSILNFIYVAVAGKQSTKPIIKQKGAIRISDKNFSKYQYKMKNHWYFDTLIRVNNKHLIRINLAEVTVRGPTFSHIMTRHYSEQFEIEINIPEVDILAFQIVVSYLTNGMFVISRECDENLLMEVYKLADYFCIKELKAHCEDELFQLISKTNYQSLLLFSQDYHLPQLGEACALKKLTELISKKEVKIEDQISKSCPEVKRLYNLIKFDLTHSQNLAQIKGLNVNAFRQSNNSCKIDVNLCKKVSY